MKMKKVKITPKVKQLYIDKGYINDDTSIGTFITVKEDDYKSPKSFSTFNVWMLMESKPFRDLCFDVEYIDMDRLKEISNFINDNLHIKKYIAHTSLRRIAYFVKYDVEGSYLERFLRLQEIPSNQRTDSLQYLCLCYGDIEGSKRCEEKSERVAGKNNPAYNHGGKFSPFSKNFIKYQDLSEEETLEKTKVINDKAKKSFAENGNNSLTIQYYLDRGYTEEEGKKLISERQSTFSLEKCIEKYGEEAGRERWLERQKKWHNSYKKSNFSKISQELFWDISINLCSLSNIHFAELSENKLPDFSGKNNELRMVLDKVILPDFIDTSTKKIIEFDGTYWHGRVGHGNQTRELKRDMMMYNHGYSVLHISEDDYKKDKEKVIDTCLNFLKQ